MNKIASFIASGFFSGYLPVAPGTWGTAVAAFICYLVCYIQPEFEIYWMIGLTAISIFGGIWSINRLPYSWEHDDSKIVIDEIAGLFVTMLFVPLNLTNIVLAFLLFRIFDIAKPLGIRSFDQRETNWSVMVDDIVAGVYSNIVLQILIVLLPWI